MRGYATATWIGLLTLAIPSAALVAQESESEAAESAWESRLDFGLSLTEGNSNTETFNFRGLAESQRIRSRFRFTADVLKSDTADDRFQQVDPGFTWVPGEAPPEVFSSTVVEPGVEPDAEKYHLEAMYERTVSREKQLAPGVFNWHFGTSWDRNEDAGLIGRTVVFAGLGHDWWTQENLRLRTRYGLSYTDRDERTADPEKDQKFFGYRLSLFYRQRWGPRVFYENQAIFNRSFANENDYSAQMRQELDVPMSKRLSLTVSLQWLFNNLPAFEDLDIVARVATRDPDGIPGNGDEFFETVDEGGARVVFGSGRERKKSLDTVISTALRITF